MKTLLFALALSLISINTSWATVGGDQYLEFLGYEPTDKKVYLLRHYEDGRGRLPQLYYFDLKSKNPNKLNEVTSIYRNPKTGKIDIDQYEDSHPFNKQLTAIKNRLQPLQKINNDSVKLTYLNRQEKQVPVWFDKYDNTKPDSQKEKVSEYHYRYQLSSHSNGETKAQAKKYISSPQTAISYRQDLQINQAFTVPNQPYKIVGMKYLGDQFETGYSWEDAVLLEKAK